MRQTYINHYSGLLEVKGEGVLCREDTELWHKSSRNWAKEYDTLGVTEGITEIGEGYLEFFSHIDCIILSRTVESVAASSELLKLWRKKRFCSAVNTILLLKGSRMKTASDFFTATFIWLTMT